ncbi:MAG TPA: peptidoglycan-binding domain-containing protein [Bryobacteraceae bacterium]|nr:peptidoglycan-binding domain-containing protein [Bryobacteraceae bacterium]
MVFSLVIAGGMAGFASVAQARGMSQTEVRNAQQQLKNDGYYNGTVDGVDGPMTHAAIRKYQTDNNLTVNGRLDMATCKQLGIQNGPQASNTVANEANSSNANQANSSKVGEANQSENGTINNPSAATVRAAQRSLREKGFYKGNLNGAMGSETQAAIREFQKNSNLNVTGQLDQATLSNLGVSK